LHTFEKKFCGTTAHLLFGLVNRRQWHREMFHQAEVIESHDRKLLGNPDLQGSQTL
jgi:hypothetical protein